MCEGRWAIGYKTFFKFHFLYWFYATLLCPNNTLWVILFPSSTNNLLPGLSCYSVKWFGGLWINRNPSDPPSLPCYHPRPRPLGPYILTSSFDSSDSSEQQKVDFVVFFFWRRPWIVEFCNSNNWPKITCHHICALLTWKNIEHFQNHVILSNCVLAHLSARLS